MVLSVSDVNVWTAALDRLEGVPHGPAAIREKALNRWPTPGAMALELVPTTVQTGMLDRLDAAMVAADTGNQRRWVINTPPQEGKTDRICRDTGVWFLLRNPNRRIIIASYQQGLAERSTLAARRLIEAYGANPGHPDEDNRLGLAMDPSRSAAGNWRLAGHTGGMVAVGIGSGTTGRPGDVIVVDDPLPDPEAADSAIQRQKVIDWWTGVVQTRLIATSIVIVVQTRWHEDDLSGWLIANNGGGDSRRYEVLSIPAQAETDDPLGRAPGEWLISARDRSPSDWLDIQKEITKGGARWWFALYQQRPAPPSGDTFRLEWFDRDRVWERPPGAPPVIVIDPADNTGSGDEAGILVASTGDDQRIYLGPDYSGHYTVARWVRVALLAAARHKAGSLAYEQSLSGLARDVAYGWKLLHKQARILKRHMKKHGAWSPVMDVEVVEAATTELCHPDDPETTWQQTRTELLELWPLVDAVLDYSDTGPSIRRIIPKGSKAWRAQAASPRYEHRRVSHIGNLAILEHQMITWQQGQKSPDRLDTAVHAVLLLSGSTGTSIERSHERIPTRSSERHLARQRITSSTRR